MSAERKRRLEAVGAENAVGWANERARIDEAVVHGADAVGAAELAAIPVGLLLGRGGALRRRTLWRRALYRGPSSSLCGRRLIRERRSNDCQRGNRTDERNNLSHDTPPDLILIVVILLTPPLHNQLEFRHRAGDAIFDHLWLSRYTAH